MFSSMTYPWLTRSIVIGLGLVALTWCAFVWFNDSAGEENLKRLLAGDPSIALTKFEIEYQQRRVICSNAEVVRYLENCLRRNNPDLKVYGTSYLLRLSFSDGTSLGVETTWSTEGFMIWFREGGLFGENLPKHGVVLSELLPKQAEEMVEFLSRPHMEVRGAVLVIE